MIRVTTVLIALFVQNSAHMITYDSTWSQHPGFNIISQSPAGVEIVFSIKQLAIDEVEINGVPMHSISIPGVILPNNEGAPNLPGTGRYIAVPQGAQARVMILSSRTEVYSDIDIAPAPNIPLETDTSPLCYQKDASIYGRNTYYPDKPVTLSKPMKMRGVDVVILGIMPFQYNPVTRKLIVYKDLRVRVDFVGGNGHFGEDRLRSAYWEPILQGHLLNYQSLPKIDFYNPERTNTRSGYEYIIIVPDDTVFERWGDTIKAWRKLQGISSEVFTLTEVGGSTPEAIEAFIDSAYNNWAPAPVAVLLLSDHPSSGDTYGIPTTSIGDNKYADTDGDSLPDLNIARICAQTDTHLNIMINKFLSYERSPYTYPNFYNHPLTSTSWQTERWFQLCSEVMAHFWINGLGKNPVRQYEIYSGIPTPGCPWSTRQGTAPVVQYWHGLGWLPDLVNPYDTSFWDNGSPIGINNTINDGTFLFVLHDHASFYRIEHLAGLFNSRYPFAFLFDVSYGEFNAPDSCFAEVWHRMPGAGGLGGIAPLGIGYSFVNDTYGWGFFDGLWPQFDPGYPAHDLPGYENLRPGFANASGKYYLHASWMPDSAGMGYSYKVTTFHLYHMHGDAFTTLYSEIPQSLNVAHPPTMVAGSISFPVSANDSSIIALTVNGEIIGTAEGTGSPVPVAIPPQTPGSTAKVTVTKANYYRYQQNVPVVPEPYNHITVHRRIIDDTIGGNGDSLINPGETIDYGIWAINLGNDTAYAVYAILFKDTSDLFVTLNIDSAWYGDIPGNDTALSDPYYNFSVAANCPNGYNIDFMFIFYDINDSVYYSYTTEQVLAPVLEYENHTIVGGNGNGILDPGETANLVVTLKNTGGAMAESTAAKLLCPSTWISIIDSTGSYEPIAPGNMGNNTSDPYTVTADTGTPIGTEVDFSIIVNAGVYHDTIDFPLIVGKIVPSDTGYYYAYWSGGPHAQCPVFDWMAIDSSQSTYPGVSLDLGDDQYVYVNLPFSFRFYGMDYNEITVSSNGWVSMGRETGSYRANYGIPDANGPRAMIAGLWDDLDPGNGGAPSDIYYYYDSLSHRFIIEYFRVEHYPSGFHETFEIILHDPVFYPTPTGDGEIIVQYLLEMQQADNTLGIENSSETIGIQYYFDGVYDSLAVPVTDSFAIKYTTWPPSTPGVSEYGKFSTLPMKTKLASLFPNPYAKYLNIKYQLAQTSDIVLCVYDVTGRLVRTLVQSSQEANHYTIMWDSRDKQGRMLPAGVYFIRFTARPVGETGKYSKTEKVILLR